MLACGCEDFFSPGSRFFIERRGLYVVVVGKWDKVPDPVVCCGGGASWAQPEGLFVLGQPCVGLQVYDNFTVGTRLCHLCVEPYSMGRRMVLNHVALFLIVIVGGCCGFFQLLFFDGCVRAAVGWERGCTAFEMACYGCLPGGRYCVA